MKTILSFDYFTRQQLSLPLHQSSYSDETESKSSGERVLDNLLHLRFFMFQKILSFDYWVCQQLCLKPFHQSSYSDETDTKSSGGMVPVHLLHLRIFMFQKILYFDSSAIE